MSDNLPLAIDLSHHLNKLSRSRIPSPLKDLFKYMRSPGMVSLAGGLPHPSVFPFEGIDLRVFAPDASLAPGEKSGQTSTVTFSVPKYSAEKGQTDLATALQYNEGSGSPVLRDFLREFTSRIITPAYADWQILINAGNTDGWSKVVGLLCEVDDWILVEEHTFASSIALWAPICKGAAVAMDKDGIIPERLDDMLEKWDTTHPGTKRPHVLYTIPVGQNPTGSTMGLERKEQVYAVCVKWDIIIIEDDPYYFLQLPPYAPPSQRNPDDSIAKAVTEKEFVASLVPTFLHVDYQGRVIRLDTFSKTLGPGNRLGYFVCNPMFTERLLRATEVTTQAASGWSQAIVQELLVNRWGHDGLIRWLMGVRDSYAVRRDWMCDLLAENFDILPSGDDITDDVIAVPKGHGEKDTKKPCFSFTPPKAGMFVYIKVYLEHTALYKKLKAAGEGDLEIRWTESFWMSMIEEKVLLVPGQYYAPIIGPNERVKPEAGLTFFRLAFSYETKEEMTLGIQRMSKVFEKYWSD